MANIDGAVAVVISPNVKGFRREVQQQVQRMTLELAKEFGTSIKITISEEATRKLLGPTGPIGQYVDRLGEKVLVEASMGTPVDTGKLRKSMKKERIGWDVQVSGNTKYAIFVHAGTKPHVIRPKNAKALRWEERQKPSLIQPFKRQPVNIVFAQEVHHPGTKAQPWLEQALVRAMR